MPQSGGVRNSPPPALPWMIPSPVPTSCSSKSENALTLCPLIASTGLEAVKPGWWHTAQPTLANTLRPSRFSEPCPRSPSDPR